MAHCGLLQTGLQKDDGQITDKGEFEAMMVKAITDARISSIAAKVEELTANFNRMNTFLETNRETEASFVKTCETHDLQLKTFIANCETKIKEIETPAAKASGVFNKEFIDGVVTDTKKFNAKIDILTKAVRGLESASLEYRKSLDDNRKCIFDEVKEMMDVNNAHTATLLQASAATTHSATQKLLQASATSTQATTKTLLAKAFGQLEDRDEALQKHIIDFEKRLVNVEDSIEANRDLEASFVNTSETHDLQCQESEDEEEEYDLEKIENLMLKLYYFKRHACQSVHDDSNSIGNSIRNNLCDLAVPAEPLFSDPVAQTNPFRSKGVGLEGSPSGVEGARDHAFSISNPLGCAIGNSSDFNFSICNSIRNACYRCAS